MRIHPGSCLPFMSFALLLAAFSQSTAREPTSPPFYANKSELLIYIDKAGNKQAIADPKDWPKRRRHILANMQLVMGPQPDSSHSMPLDVHVTEEIKTPRYIRNSKPSSKAARSTFRRARPPRASSRAGTTCAAQSPRSTTLTRSER